MRDHDSSLKRIDPRYFGFDEVHPPIKHRTTQIERNIAGLALAERESHQRRVKNKLPITRNQRDLMFIVQLLRDAFRRDNAAKPTTQDQNFRHRNSFNQLTGPLRRGYVHDPYHYKCWGFVSKRLEAKGLALRGITQLTGISRNPD